MFGIMKHSCCDNTPTQKQDYQKSYCGTCKSIARQYGHKSRILLNYDAVFLSQILGAISPVVSDQSGISTFRCFDIPDESEIPPNLQYAANVNVLFSSLKSIDTINDEGGLFARIFQKFIKKETSIAFTFFEERGLTKNYLQELLEEQNRRELQILTLDKYAKITSIITGAIFAQGTIEVGRSDLKSLFQTLGETFGKLIYFIDAYQDYDKDLKNNQFNAFYTLSKGKKPLLIMNDVIQKTLIEVEQAIEVIPLLSKDSVLFISRLHMNVNRIISNTSCSTKKSPEKTTETETIRIGMKWNMIASIIVIMVISTQGVWGQSIYIVATNQDSSSFQLTYWLMGILGLSWLGLLVYILKKKKIIKKFKKYQTWKISDPEKQRKKSWNFWEVCGMICSTCCGICGLTCLVALCQDSGDCGNCECGGCENADCDCGDCDCGECDCNCQ